LGGLAGGNPIPDDVRRFVDRFITSVEQLELLLLLRKSPERVWSADAASRELRTAPASAESRLADLAKAKLVVREGDGYTYRPEPATDRLVDGLAAAYASYRTRLISMIFEKPSEQLRDFADAFRLRGDD
jgi:DNA-binding IclR family transcriptional regulator